MTRTVTVPYRVTNPGPGDSYGSAVTAVGGGPGVTVLGPTAHPAGRPPRRRVPASSPSATSSPSLGPPCQLIVLGCQFTSSITASLPDALDVPTTKTVGFTVTAPNLPRRCDEEGAPACP